MHGENIFKRSHTQNFIIKSHIHTNLFQIFIVEKGNVKFEYESVIINLDKPCILSIPANTTHGFEFSPDIEGKVLTLSQSFVETIFQYAPKVLLELSQVRILTNPEHKRYQMVERIVYRLYDELLEDLPERKFALQSYFSLLLTEIYRLSVEQNENLLKVENRYVQYFKAFQQNIRNSYNPQKSIAQYADELKISPIHLNRVCKEVGNKSALQTVTEFFILEAKKHLEHTDFTISEIAYRLNFDDAAYFTRVFKKYTGVSPKVFREQQKK
ncbi:MAG: AraC family transcriptional regulator [Runella sp.]